MRKRLLEVSVFTTVLAIFLFANLATDIPAHAPAPTNSIPELDREYIKTMRSYNNEYLNKVSDDVLIGAAKFICSDFMYGYSLYEVIDLRLQDNSEETRLVFGYILKEGTKSFCPDYQYYAEELTW